jgi:hypothetical protein
MCPNFKDDLETFYSSIKTLRVHDTFSTAVHSHKVLTPHIDVYTLVGIPPSEEAWFLMYVSVKHVAASCVYPHRQPQQRCLSLPLFGN